MIKTELNIGGIINIPFFINKDGSLNKTFKDIDIRIHDGLLSHPSGGGLSNRIIGQHRAFDDILYNAIEELQRVNIPFDLLMTNYQATPKDIFNKRGLKVLEFLNSLVDCGVVVSSKGVGKAIREKFPTLKVKWSTTGYYRDSPKNHLDYVESLNGYDSIVLPTEFNLDYEKLQHFKDPKKLELIILDDCYLGCPHRREHYQLISSNNYNFCIENKVIHGDQEDHFCEEKYRKKNIFKKNLILPQDLLKLKSIGFNKFKIASRSVDSKDLRFYLNLITPVLNHIVS